MRMTHLYRLLVACFLTILCFSVHAQEKKKVKREKTTFGLRLGGHFTKFTGKDYDGNSVKLDFKPGGSAGFNIQIPMAQHLYLQLGLQASLKGAKEKNNNGTATVSTTSVELPVLLLYAFPAGKGKLLAGIGGYAAYAVAGKIKLSASGESVKIIFENTVPNPQPDEAYMKPLDAGALLTFGYQFANGLSIQAFGQMGIMNVNTDFPNDPSNQSALRNIGFGLSLGYRFH